jgi:hypothetical protein
MISALSGLVSPYLLYLKLAAAVVVVAAIVGAGLYVRSVFAARDALLVDNSRISTELTVEKLKYTELMRQAEQISAMNKDIIEAVKRVKINSSIYIDKVEAAPLPPPAASGTVLIPGGLSKIPLSFYSRLPVVNYPLTERTATGPP